MNCKGKPEGGESWRQSETHSDDAALDPELEIIDRFRYNLLEDRGESSEESTLFRDLKEMKEKALAKKRARRLKKLKKVKFQDNVTSFPFQRTCCKCKKTIKEAEETKDSYVTIQRIGETSVTFNKEIRHSQHECERSRNFRPLMRVSSIDMYGSIIPKECLPL